ncbi:hypothetical protein THASP1DRAFT_26557 [Thamnocephalis sphaerospora]|uniref:RGS domain-containing protein n=1 Tax=Thamnocephalis sphaerospora TaxID=78915 RepID=A0A4V1IVQ4_9FUNG|nr:hypothetical protein THASP1DRAFT_26557 [Thamnocephalis sphaerospora]|eukprot:RKP04869.1 hypothetical protein THASP1DRAFT_26557 [Thamnocephalis sphaerospora]
MAEDARERLLAILEGRTKPPISHREFLGYLGDQTPGHRYNEFVPLVNFYDWLNTYRGYFNTLPEEERHWSPPPTADLHAAYLERPLGSLRPAYHPEYAAQHPYRNEINAAVDHYMTGALFSDQAVDAVRTASKATTHPDIFLPALEDAYRRLTPEAARFVQAAVYNIRPSTRMSRLIIVLLTLVTALVMIAGFIWAKLSPWLRLIPLVPLTAALIMLPMYIRRICLIRYLLGITDRPEWDTDGHQTDGAHLVVIEPRILHMQRQIVWRMAGVGLLLSIIIWIGIMLLPQ